MFMRSQARHPRTLGIEGRLMKTEWKASAVVADDSVQFAATIEKILNECSAEGFELVHMLLRSTDNGIVLVHQRHSYQDPVPATHMSEGGN